MAGPLDRIRLLDRFRRKSRRYRAVFETPEGQWVLRDLAREAGLHGVPAVPGDPHMSYFNMGRESVVKGILSTMYVDPEITVQRITEELKRNGQEFDEDD